MDPKPDQPTGAPDPAYSVAVYDAATGEIVLIHHFGAMPGAPLPERERLDAIAIEHAAQRHRRESTSLAVLPIEASALQPKHTYRVSLRDRALVEDRSQSGLAPAASD